MHSVNYPSLIYDSFKIKKQLNALMIYIILQVQFGIITTLSMERVRQLPGCKLMVNKLCTYPTTRFVQKRTTWTNLTNPAFRPKLYAVYNNINWHINCLHIINRKA